MAQMVQILFTGSKDLEFDCECDGDQRLVSRTTQADTYIKMITLYAVQIDY